MSYDLLVTPSRWTSRGEALARDERGLPLLVFGAIPGEICDVWVQHEGEHQSVGLWRGSKRRSKHRVSPACGRWAVCGGCPIMHMDGEGQWAARS
ncbi:MAG: 23S rRNA (uracil1939-C5)-methyltransferase, partial [Kiritimatiellia bacterium]